MFELVCDVTCDKPWTISPIGRENKIPFNVSILLFRFFTSVTVGEGRNSSALMAFSMWSVMSGLVLLWVSQAAARKWGALWKWIRFFGCWKHVVVWSERLVIGLFGSMWVVGEWPFLWLACAEHGVDLDECERAGLSAGAAAVRGACAALELECPLPDVELRSSYPSSIPEGKIRPRNCIGIDCLPLFRCFWWSMIILYIGLDNDSKSTGKNHGRNS